MLYPLSYGGPRAKQRDLRKVSTDWPRCRTRYGEDVRWVSVVLVLVVLLTGCVSRPEPAPATQRTDAPPWDAPRDAISYIEAAGLPQQSLGDEGDPWILHVQVTAQGRTVEVPAHIGIDRLRAVQAPVHTHESGGEVWLEGDGNRTITLGQFFTLWGVSFSSECIGAVCGTVTVTADGTQVAEPVDLVLRGHEEIRVEVS